MKNRLAVLMSALCLSVMTACGNVAPEETQGEPALQDPQTHAFYCPVCPVAPGQVEEMSREPATDTVTAQIICPPCEGTSCGDGYCQYPENSTNCSVDCGTPSPYCGDHVCNNGESCSTCSGDCGSCGTYCGDGICQYPETRTSCWADCYITSCSVPPCP
jgi:hypothetical protein